MSKATRGSGAAFTSALPLFTNRIVGAFNRHRLHRRDAYVLSGLDDRMLKDIGLSRSDIFQAVNGGRQRHD